ncbi:hypothetical protein U9M48_032028 [Paspalum notatum var. saurae]|uniref:Uncharacterized protein n=1 Tax=Paspalum notatum var. saurae TaxID=547442 RepID=A0AAQ3U806_PASNO
MQLPSACTVCTEMKGQGRRPISLRALHSNWDRGHSSPAASVEQPILHHGGVWVTSGRTVVPAPVALRAVRLVLTICFR